MKGRVIVPVVAIEFHEGGNTIWIHGPQGSTTLLVLAGIPAWHRQEQRDLVDAKMAINRARRWNLTGDGHGQHVGEES